MSNFEDEDQIIEYFLGNPGNLSKFIDTFHEHKAKYSLNECFHGFGHYKSAKHYPKIKINGTVFPQQVVIMQSINNKHHIQRLNEVDIICQNQWCCNPRHLEVNRDEQLQ